MIYCCGGYHNPFQTVILDSNLDYKDRKLEIAVCPSCGKLVACLIQFNIKNQSYEIYRPKRKYTAKFLRNLESGKWKEVGLKYGTKEKSSFVFGLNRQFKNGDIYQYAVNFNGEKKLVKVIEKGRSIDGKKKTTDGTGKIEIFKG